jgi:beta-hydroxylase
VKTAFFSVLGPRKRLPEHRGPYKGVIRYHLGLKIPSPPEACGIRVGGETAHWQEGKSLLFDDTYQHEAWNDTDEDRVVLFLDIVRPMPFPYSWLNTVVITGAGRTSFVRNARRNHADWEQRFERLRAQRERHRAP